MPPPCRQWLNYAKHSGYLLSGVKNYYKYIVTTPPSPIVSSDTNNYAIAPVDALAIDKKLDDGLPYTGNVLSVGCGSFYATTTTFSCFMVFQIGATNGTIRLYSR